MVCGVCCFILICGFICLCNIVSVFEKFSFLFLKRFLCCLWFLFNVFNNIVCVLWIFIFKCMFFIWLKVIFCKFWFNWRIWFCLCWMVFCKIFVIFFVLIVNFFLWWVSLFVKWESLIFICLIVLIGLLVWIIFWWICLCKWWYILMKNVIFIFGLWLFFEVCKLLCKYLLFVIVVCNVFNVLFEIECNLFDEWYDNLWWFKCFFILLLWESCNIKY